MLDRTASSPLLLAFALSLAGSGCGGAISRHNDGGRSALQADSLLLAPHPRVVMASGISYPYHVAVNATDVLWVASRSDRDWQLWRMNKFGGTPTAVLTFPHVEAPKPNTPRRRPGRSM
jgi:hypothetical protein